MKYFISVLFSIIFLGCSGLQIANNITQAEVALSGNKPPKFFRVANLYVMENYTFDMQSYTIALPSAKEEDFSQFDGWQGTTHYDKEITLYLGTNKLGYPYHIQLTFDTSKYTEREKAIEAENIKYIRSKIKIDNDDKLCIAHFGKEQYKCTVMKYTKEQYPLKKYTAYECYDFNQNKTKYRSVYIRLTYTKENNASINQKYSYQDLENRAQRMLNSLYIKDEWDK